MAEPRLEALVRSHDRIAIVDLSGEINAAAEESLNAVYAQAESLDPTAILLNFTAVEYINSIGIALIVNMLMRARNSNRRLLSYGLSEHYAEIFRITRLADFMTIVSDEQAALAETATQP